MVILNMFRTVQSIIMVGVSYRDSICMSTNLKQEPAAAEHLGLDMGSISRSILQTA